MTTTRLIAATAAVALTLTACGQGIQVRSALSPQAGIEDLRTFRILPVPQRHAGGPPSANDPMLVNSITNRALRNDLVQGFEGRGYVVADSNADFSVAYYASTKDKLDIMRWDYGYAWWPHWWGWRAGGGPGGAADVTEYTEGTVVVDVIDPKSKELLWRGKGVARVSDDQEKYEQELQKTVTAILQKFPARAEVRG